MDSNGNVTGFAGAPIPGVTNNENNGNSSSVLNNPYADNGISSVGKDSSSTSSNKSFSDYNGDWESYLTDLANSGDTASLDKLLDYMMSEQSAMTAREWTANREDNQYQRLVADLKAAGINPYTMINSGASPVSSASSGNSYSGSSFTNKDLKSEQNTQKWISIITGIITSVIMAAAIAA